MNKEYHNVLIQHPRYVRMLVIMAAFLVLTCGLILYTTEKGLEAKKPLIAAKDFQVEKNLTDKRKFFVIGFAAMTVLAIPLIVHLKRKTRVAILPDGVEYREFNKRVFIPWDEIRDMKVLNPGSSVERCRMKGKKGEFTFNVFFIESDAPYKVTGAGVLDEHGHPLSSSISKNKLYKEIKMRMKK